MADLNWCTFCDSAVSPFSESLYCSEQCLRSDALRNHPLLGYTYPEFTDFPRPKPTTTHNTTFHSKSYSSSSNYSSTTTSPALTATSSQSDSSLLNSLPKFELNTTTNTNTKSSNTINYFALFNTTATTIK